MNTTQVAIEILYKSVTEARNETKRLKEELDALKRERISINIEEGAAKQRLNDIRATLRSLQDEAALARDLLALDPKDDKVKANLKEITQLIHTWTEELHGYQRLLDLIGEREQANAVKQADAKQKVADATKRQTDAEKAYNDATKKNDAEQAAADERRKKAKEEEAELVRRIAREAEEAAEREREAFEQFNDELERTEAIAGRIGDLFKAIGTVSGWTAEFADSIGNAFSGMSGIFETDIARYATASLTHQFMNKLVGNTDKVVSRYDILNTFLPYMAIAGVGEGAAKNAQDRIDQSIRGLPIGLDEATQRLRRYFMYTGNLNRATNLAIGVQSAITAGGSGQSYQTQAYNMIERMLATGDLTNIRQWQALLVGLGVSQNFIEQELGLQRGTLMASIREGTIGVEEFLGAIEKLGSGSTDAAKQMNAALGIYKSTVESWLSNIEFAVTRGNANVLSALDSTLQRATGTGITGYLENWRNTENNIFGWASKYITSHPEQLGTIVGYVEQILGAISRFSASEYIDSTLKYIGQLVSVFTYLLDKVPEGKLEKFVAFATSMAGTLGKVFDAAGKAPFMAAVFERFENFDWNMFAEDLASVAGSLERIIAALLKKIPDETMSKLLAFGLIFGKPVQGVMNGIGNGIKTGAGLWTQFALWRYLKANGLPGAKPAVTSDPYSFFVDAFEGGAAGNWFTNSLGASTFGGLFSSLFAGLILPSTIMTLIENALSNRRVNEIESGYTGSTSDLLAEIALLEAAEAFDENGNVRIGYKSDSERLTALQRVLAQRRAWEERNFQGTMYPAGRGYESHGTYDFSANLNKVTAGVSAITSAIDVQALTIKSSLITQLYEAQKAYQSLYDSARESITGQISLWEKFTLNEDVHYVAEGKGNSKANMEYNTGIVERYADAVTYLSDYVEKHPEAAGYIGQMVGTMDIADLATIENLVAYIQAGKDLPLDAWNALADAIERASDALARWNQLNTEKEYTYEEGRGLIQQIFGDDPDVMESFDQMWGDAETQTESGLKVIKDTIYKELEETKRVTKKQIADIDGAFMEFGYDPQWFFNTAESMMMALRAGIITAGDKAIWEARRVAYNIKHAFEGITYSYDPNSFENDKLVNGGGWSHGGLIYAANGRLIAFEPRGTDTVPAMLTPGEFVMRKQAVDTFGAAFMKSINDLNIGAAFDRLINTKLSNPRGFVNNTYNNRDDHSTHNQYIKTNNPAFATKRAGRFVRAMA